jgi:hypothetical protein
MVIVIIKLGFCEVHYEWWSPNFVEIKLHLNKYVEWCGMQLWTEQV